MSNPLIDVVWFILPAYAANSAAIDVSGLPVLKYYSTPIDFGRSFGGKRLFGDGKTWRGLVSGVLTATLCAHIMGVYQIEGLLEQSAFLGFLLGLGAMLGDLTASFVKRRLGFLRGHPVFLLDQLDYILGAFIFALPVYSFNVEYFIIACIITLPVHYLANVVAWLINLKKKPW